MDFMDIIKGSPSMDAITNQIISFLLLCIFIIVNFYYCEYSKAIWIAAENWITSAQSINISFSVQNVLLGFGEQRNDVLTLITVLIKQQLFIWRCNNSTCFWKNHYSHKTIL